MDRRLRPKAGERLLFAIERQEWLNQPSYRFEKALALGFALLGKGGPPVRNALHGTWLGHPLHPLLINLPTGAWSAAAILDVMSIAPAWRRRRLDAARLCIGIGIAGAIGATISGLLDWQYTHDDARRTGVVHAAVNTAALGLYGSSWLLRTQKRDGLGVATGMTGLALVLLGGFLGGHLVYGHRVGVDHALDPLVPDEFTAAIAIEELEDRKPHRVIIKDTGLVVLRNGEQVYAFAEHCSHLGAPLCDGWIHDGSIVCPWHGSRFDLNSGESIRGPATAPIISFETRVLDGVVEVRRVPRERTSAPQLPVGKRPGNAG